MRRATRRPIGRFTAGFALSLAITALLNSLLVVLKETNPAIKTWMTNATGHHWITHAIAIVASYVILGYVLSYAKAASRISARTLLIITTGAVALACVIIIGYYLTHI